MKTKEVIITFFLSGIVCTLFVLNYYANKYILCAENIHKVYFNGEIVGYISNDDEFYDIINQKQTEIKEKFNVETVYPPEGLSIVNTNSYNVELSTADEIYEKISNMSSFTIEGNIVYIKDGDGKKLKTLNVLNEEDFDNAMHTFVLAFISEEEYNNYINNTQPVIETTGRTIESMYFEENISVKKGLMPVDENIYTNAEDLTQVLLYDEDSDIKSYKVKEGDTISSIAKSNKLNVREFLIINPQYSSENSLLAIGEQVNITLINPIITFSYEVNDVSDTEEKFSKKTVFDATKPFSFNEITTAGVNGLTRNTVLYKISNGETQQGAKTLKQETLVEKVDQVTTKGYQYYNPGIPFVDDGSEWGWPTLKNKYCITSYYGYRDWGDFHEGLDISCSGYGSPIYAALDGVVYKAGWDTAGAGGGGGWGVLVAHENGYYTVYAHMAYLSVQNGQRVSKGTILGGMGTTGYSTGTHLHFGVFYGIPYATGSFSVNPYNFY